VVVGSVLGDPDALADMVTTVGATRVAASIDIREGKLKVQGWVQTLTASADTVAELLRAVGIRRVIVTAVERDGTGRGPDIALTAEWVARGFSVYAAGGIARAEDLAALRASGARGAILGRALYDGRLSLEEGRKAVC
jgi:phosphoribosylformimino-5-aminoimidazole carboxamide ribotide isomerase